MKTAPALVLPQPLALTELTLKPRGGVSAGCGQAGMPRPVCDSVQSAFLGLCSCLGYPGNSKKVL